MQKAVLKVRNKAEKTKSLELRSAYRLRPDMSSEEEPVPIVSTFEELLLLLNNSYQCIGKFANAIRRSYEEVESYFIGRSKIDPSIKIRGCYVRKEPKPT